MEVTYNLIFIILNKSLFKQSFSYSRINRLIYSFLIIVKSFPIIRI